MKDLKGKVAVVTGAASGIGLATAKRLAREGMRTVLADIDAVGLERAVDEIGREGGAALAVETDVRSGAEVERLARRTLDEYGTPHVVFNNAGLVGDLAPTWRLDEASWRRAIDVNVWGVIHGVRAFVPMMLEQGEEGHVINNASLSGFFALPYAAAYHATKSAVVTITESLHYELSLIDAKVKVSLLCPGMTKTRFMEIERYMSDEERERKERTEKERAWLEAYREFIAGGMSPDEVAASVVDAIRTERFYVFPTTKPLQTIGERFRAIVEGREPPLLLTDAMKGRLPL